MCINQHTTRHSRIVYLDFGHLYVYFPYSLYPSHFTARRCPSTGYGDLVREQTARNKRRPRQTPDGGQFRVTQTELPGVITELVPPTSRPIGRRRCVPWQIDTSRISRRIALSPSAQTPNFFLHGGFLALGEPQMSRTRLAKRPSMPSPGW